MVAASAALFLPALAGTAGAVPAPGTIGTPANEIIPRAFLDTFTNFVTVDTGQVATTNGWVTSINYYAAATGTIQFLLVNGSGLVEWVSGPIPVTVTGPGTYNLSPPVTVAAGWELGYYTSGGGVIPYDCTANAWEQQDDNTGPVTVGETINAPYFGVGSTECNDSAPFGGRTYSMGADVVPLTTTLSTSSRATEWQVLNGLIAFQARLVSPALGQGIAGQMITFKLNGPDEASCTSTTNSRGVATCDVEGKLFLLVHVHSFTATYYGSAYYAPNSATGSVYIFQE
jgi:hypothetical protein